MLVSLDLTPVSYASSSRPHPCQSVTRWAEFRTNVAYKQNVLRTSCENVLGTIERKKARYMFLGDILMTI